MEPHPLESAVNAIVTTVIWLFGQWWFYVILAVIVIAVVAIVWWIVKPTTPSTHPDYPTEGSQANELALGYLQTQSSPKGAWNDPTASHIAGNADAESLADTWNIRSASDWVANLKRLVSDRRRRPDWTSYLAVRADLGARLGRKPKTREWLSAITEAGGGDKRGAKKFVTAIEYIENETKKYIKSTRRIPADTYITSLDGYALGQAVAVSTWGVGIGVADESQAREAITMVNNEARKDFASWDEFGLSYVAGRVMHWTDGEVNEKSLQYYGGVRLVLQEAFDSKREGPWATLPWHVA